jgi:HEAT repeat protein
MPATKPLSFALASGSHSCCSMLPDAARNPPDRSDEPPLIWKGFDESLVKRLVIAATELLHQRRVYREPIYQVSYRLALRSDKLNLLYMKTGYAAAIRAVLGLAGPAGCGASIRFVIVLLLLTGFGVRALADGCFVFKWNKSIDINEPTQKAIICFDSGHEHLLLQVKYEGPLEEFGWLIPTPSFPKVEKGRMEPFYELSQLTQRHFGSPDAGTHRGMLGTASAGGEKESVRVIEVKTVGAYEVAVLSAQDSGSLERWLKAHEYSFPGGKAELVEEYTRRGWYFVAAKIELNKGLAFKSVSGTSPKDPKSTAKARERVQSKLSSGELHPLLISFDTPKAIFPLKISAVSGKASEVSLYIVAKEPLLDSFIFGKSAEELGQEYTRWEAEKPKRAAQLQEMREFSKVMGYGSFLDSFYSTNRIEPIPPHLRDYTREDLVALAREGEPPMPAERLSETFYGQPGGLLQCLRVTATNLPESSYTFPALRTGEWFLTKQVQTFAAAEMHDLAFEPAFPVLARMLSDPAGTVAAQILAQFEPQAHDYLARACENTNWIERLNAVVGIERNRTPGFTDSLARLLTDEAPAVRLHALRAAEAKPDGRFVSALVGLLRDQDLEIRQEAVGYLSNHEGPSRTPFYMALARDPDATVRMASLAVATWINRYAPSDEVYQEVSRLLKDEDGEVRASALRALYQMRQKTVPRAELLPFLSSTQSMVNGMALSMLRAGPPGPIQGTATLSSAETSRLITNRLTMARLAGLKILKQNADAEAVELMLPLLRDTNKIVRNRAFYVLRTVTGEDISKNDPAKWQAWWTANKASFHPGKPLQ